MPERTFNGPIAGFGMPWKRPLASRRYVVQAFLPPLKRWASVALPASQAPALQF